MNNLLQEAIRSLRWHITGGRPYSRFANAHHTGVYVDATWKGRAYRRILDGFHTARGVQDAIARYNSLVAPCAHVRVRNVEDRRKWVFPDERLMEYLYRYTAGASHIRETRTSWRLSIDTPVYDEWGWNRGYVGLVAIFPKNLDVKYFTLQYTSRRDLGRYHEVKEYLEDLLAETLDTLPYVRPRVRLSGDIDSVPLGTFIDAGNGCEPNLHEYMRAFAVCDVHFYRNPWVILETDSLGRILNLTDAWECIMESGAVDAYLLNRKDEQEWIEQGWPVDYDGHGRAFDSEGMSSYVTLIPIFGPKEPLPEMRGRPYATWAE